MAKFFWSFGTEDNGCDVIEIEDVEKGKTKKRKSSSRWRRRDTAFRKQRSASLVKSALGGLGNWRGVDNSTTGN